APPEEDPYPQGAGRARTRAPPRPQNRGRGGRDARACRRGRRGADRGSAGGSETGSRRLTLAGFARGVVLSWGWRRRLTAFSAGALAALAMPPFGLWPILAVSLPLAVWLIDGAGGRTPMRTVLAAAA